MMTSEPSAKDIEEVRQMLVHARPEQIKRLLEDIACKPVKEVARYDA